ncbi:MAG: hypothetical protein J07AB43_11320, partial [Candidatus Nanosalina sp. J07AB43]
MKTENALEFREDAKRNGLDAELPSGTELSTVYKDKLVDILAEGVRESFSDELPYSAELVLDEFDQYDSFEDVLNSHFDDLSDFTD